MSESKWTPGPWHVTDDHPLRAVLNVRDSDAWEVASLYSGRGDSDVPDSDGVWRGDEVRIANGFLISAAPELYEALQVAELVLREHGMRALGEYKQIESALAKARGEQP